MEIFVLPAVVWWDTSQAPHTYCSCCLSCSKNKTPSLLGFASMGKYILRAKKISRVFPASSLQKVGCQGAAAHLQGPRADREVTQSQVLLETTRNWRPCNICDVRADWSRDRLISLLSVPDSTKAPALLSTKPCSEPKSS